MTDHDTDKPMPSDMELLDFLQQLTDRQRYTGVVILRESTIGRGWRLHETKGDGFKNVRWAIREAMIAEKRKREQS